MEKVRKKTNKIESLSYFNAQESSIRYRYDKTNMADSRERRGE